MEFYKAAKNVGNYLIHSEEAQLHRIRAGALATMVFAALPAALDVCSSPKADHGDRDGRARERAVVLRRR